MKWAARCSRCFSLDGVDSIEAPLSVPAAPAPVFAPAPVLKRPAAVASPEIPHAEVPPAPVPNEPALDVIRPRPRLMIVPAPEPSLDDPATELADVVDDDDEDDDLVPLSDVAESTLERYSTGFTALDHVLGGGLVKGAVVLLASPPGVGKTSLTLQMLNGLQHRCLYVTGEETCEQVAATARRVNAASSNIYPFAEHRLDKVFAKARKVRAKTIAIDSIQKMLCKGVAGRAGSPTQLKESSAQLVAYAKDTGTPLWIIGHVTSDGDIAGPRTIEHDVDVVLELVPGLKFGGNERILQCSGKNRFGPTNVKGHFELTADGFVGIDADGWNEPL